MRACKLSFSPESRGTVVGYCRKYTVGKAACVAVVLDIVLGPAKIVPVVLPAPAGGVVVADVWSSIYGTVAFGGPYGLGSWTH